MIFKRMTDTAKEPLRSTRHSAGLDLFLDETVHIRSGETVVAGTGITFELEDSDRGMDWFIDIRIRSSLGARGIMLGNGAGVVDSDYEGNEIKAILHNASNDAVTLQKGSKVMQMLILEHKSFYAKGVTYSYEERDGGLGSTDAVG